MSNKKFQLKKNLNLKLTINILTILLPFIKLNDIIQSLLGIPLILLENSSYLFYTTVNNLSL